MSYNFFSLDYIHTVQDPVLCCESITMLSCSVLLIKRKQAIYLKSLPLLYLAQSEL